MASEEAKFDFHDRFLIRQTTHPIEWLTRLGCPESFRLISEIVAAEEALDEARKSLSGRLYVAIPGLTGQNRSLALDLRRFLCAPELRPIPKKFVPLLAALGEEETGSWRTCERLGTRLEALLEEYSASHKAEMAAARAKLVETLREPLFAEGVLLSSHDLHEGLLRYLRRAERGDAPDSRQQRDFERGAVEHLVRAATKPTPRGLLAGVSVGSWAGRVGSATPVAPVASTRSVLEISIVRAIARRIASVPSLRRRIVPRPNPTLHRRDGKLRFLRPLARMDAMLELAENELLRAFIDLSSERQMTAEALVEEVHRRLDSAVSLEQARAYFERLVENEVIIGELEVPFEEVDGLAFLIRWLESALAADESAREDARRWLGLLEPLAADLRSSRKSPELLRDIRERILAICPDISETRIKNPLIVDCVVDPSMTVLPESILPELRRLAWLGTVPDRVVKRRGERNALELAKAFDALGIREDDWKDRRIALLDLAARASGAAGSPDHWSVPIHSEPEFGKMKAAFRSWLETKRNERGELPDSLDIDEAELLKILSLPDSTPDPLVDGEGGLNFMIAASDVDQILSGKGLIVLDGFGRDAVLGASRFLSLLRDESFVRLMQEHMDWVCRRTPGKLPADLPCLSFRARTDTAGQVAGFLPTAIECSAARSGRPASRLIPLSELLIERDAENRLEVIWRQGTEEKRVRPFYRSVLNYALFPPPARLLSFLGAMTGTSQRDPVKLSPFAPLTAETTHCPRVTWGNVVLARESWNVKLSELQAVVTKAPAKAEAEAEARTFLEVNRWRMRLGLPRFVFVQVSPAKPFYLDFLNPFCVDNLLSTIRRLGDRQAQLSFVEMLPAPEDLWQKYPSGNSFACEISVGFRWDTTGSG